MTSLVYEGAHTGWVMDFHFRPLDVLRLVQEGAESFSVMPCFGPSYYEVIQTTGEEK